jgi:quinohemoprotein ethanol dehydrogenase
VAQGRTLFAQHCALCNGDNAVGGLKDLRMLTAETHATFGDIVLGGARQDKGMASFADRLNPAQADAIHQYLIARANEDWDSVSAYE